MKIKRFVAPDMRQALRRVRETLGEDAVILSNKSVAEGVELTAAIDLVADEEIEVAGRELRAPREQDPVARRSTTSPRHQAATAQRQREAARTASPRRAEQAAAEVSQQELLAMREEMQNLRRWLQAELSSMSWHDLGQRAPHVQELFQRLMQLGLAADLAQDLVQRVGGIEDLELAWRKALFFLAGEIPVCDQDVLERGGVLALVGPTGVGKTTSIAKIAARFALRHGHRNIGLISTDNFRIGARDQLHTYGRILNVPVRTADDPQAMGDAIDSLSDRRLILIDTAGMGANNERLEEQIETLQAVGPNLTTLLTLSATTEGAAMARAVDLFSATRPDACMLTKLDEAASLGAAISAVIHSGLPLAWIADGQRVPEDLAPARAHPLVERAAALLEEYPAECDQTYVALSYKGGRSNARV
ncbi:MAG: flagellar biosynthesis protein FlhF [Gammaproteobacteria bacterium]|nr:MAG: flagellar biosynthesis protein FlhF [Gammaproteobacteria bacterium]